MLKCEMKLLFHFSTRWTLGPVSTSWRASAVYIQDPNVGIIVYADGLALGHLQAQWWPQHKLDDFKYFLFKLISSLLSLSRRYHLKWSTRSHRIPRHLISDHVYLLSGSDRLQPYVWSICALWYYSLIPRKINNAVVDDLAPDRHSFQQIQPQSSYHTTNFIGVFQPQNRRKFSGYLVSQKGTRYVAWYPKGHMQKITPLIRQNEVVTSFWHNNDVIIA